jgi:hypothetical protein
MGWCNNMICWIKDKSKCFLFFFFFFFFFCDLENVIGLGLAW